jgi:CubicO group peptidase (beta-lactamase class C family)
MIAFLLAGSLLASPAPPASHGSADELRDELERRGWELTEEQRVPGVALALVRDGALAWTLGCGWADVAEEREVDGEETVFNIGSISKTVAAWGLMELVERGALALDAPVVTQRWKLPESEFDPRGVTLRRLLSHTAGLTLHGYPGFWPPTEVPALEASLAGATNGAGDVRLEAEPGTRWKYSGGGYTLAQLLLEETTGASFADFMRTEVLVPLGMTRSDYAWTEEILARSATPYDDDAKPLPRGGPRFAALAAAGLQTTAADLGRFAAASLARSGELPVLTAETLALMQTPAEAAPEYGLGYQFLEAGGVPLIGHGGANEGWMSLMALRPETGDGLVVLTNGSNGRALLRPLLDAWVAHLGADVKSAR